MVDLKIYLLKCMKRNTRKSLLKLVSNMTIILLILWLLIWSNLKVDLYGPVKTMMVMYNLIHSLKVLVPLVLWHLFFYLQTDLLNLKLLMVLSPDITDYTNKVKKLLPTLSPVSMHGLLVFGTEVKKMVIKNFKIGAKKLEKAVVDTVEGGSYTKDLAILVLSTRKPERK